jgi:aspartate/methionine/tyrosine aminotransferase
VSETAAIHPLAAELNQVLEPTAIGRSLSQLGTRLYFPKGVVAQSAEAAEHADRFNATVGLAATGGQPMHLPSIAERLPGLTAEEAFAYAPTAGLPHLRDRWAAELRVKNPSLPSAVSRPVVTAGLTAGIAMAADLFVDDGDPVLLPDLVWGNYRLIMGERRGARVDSYPFFAAEAASMDVGAVERALAEHPAGSKVVLMFNFPHNPTGYSPKRAEAERLTAVLASGAERGLHLVVLVDDAYHGLFYEEETLKESLFARLADLHQNLLAIKIDGPTKEEYVWGFRIGFVTVGAAGLAAEHYRAFEQKAMAAIRSTVSSANRMAQHLVLAALDHPEHASQRAANQEELRRRYLTTVRELGRRSSAAIRPLPFNSGYFMCFHLPGGTAEAVRRYLLYERGIGTISVDEEHLRVAFAGVDTADLPELYAEIYAAAERCAAQGDAPGGVAAASG